MRPWSWIWIGISVLFGLFFIALGVAFFSGFLFFRPIGTPIYYYPFFPFGWLFGLFWFFVIFAVFRWLFWPWGWGYRRRYWRQYDYAHGILRERYARGEITKEQFDQMMRDLQQHS